MHGLGDDGHPPAQIHDLGLARVYAPQGYRALVRIVQAVGQPAQRGLAAAGAPQQPEHPARLELKREVLQHRLVLVIGKGHVPEDQGQRTFGDLGPRPIHDLALDGPQLGQALGGRADVLQGLDLLRQLADRPAQQVGIVDQQVDRAHAHRSFAVQIVAGDDGQSGDQGHQGPAHPADDQEHAPRFPPVFQDGALKLVQPT